MRQEVVYTNRCIQEVVYVNQCTDKFLKEWSPKHKTDLLIGFLDPSDVHSHVT